MALTVASATDFAEKCSRLPSFPLFLAYLLLVFISPRLQPYFSPMQLRKPMLVYNILCSSASLVALIGLVYGLALSPSIFDKHDSPVLQRFFHLYWSTKVLELMDTVFMVLRHRSRQISFLHVYHHSSMLVLTDYARHGFCWPAITPFIALNSLVHVLLYAYYAATSISASLPPAWKRHLTELQIAQFLLDLVLALWGFVYHGFCPYSIFYGIGMTGLFSNFYYYAYIRKRPLKVDKGPAGDAKRD